MFNLFKLLNKKRASKTTRKRFRWVSNPNQKGCHEFTFDGVKIYNLFRDYPWALTPEEKKIFDRKNPYWANFFKDRADMPPQLSRAETEETQLLEQLISTKLSDED